MHEVKMKDIKMLCFYIGMLVCLTQITSGLADWQRNKKVKERMEIMFLEEHATDVTFKVSSLQTGQ